MLFRSAGARPALGIDLLKLRREFCSLVGVIGGEKLERGARVPESSGGIDPWRKGEADHVDAMRCLSARAPKERLDPEWNLPCAVEHLEGGAHDDAELVLDGNHVRDAADHGKHGELAEERASIWVIGQDPLRDLEGESAPRKLREGVDGTGAVRIHHPRPLRGFRRHSMVIHDADQDSLVARLLDARTIGVQPFEKKLVSGIEKAIRDANLGLNPASAGDTIRVPMPALTEERRKELSKHVHKLAEEGRNGIRNVRRDANDRLKKLLKEHERKRAARAAS